MGNANAASLQLVTKQVNQTNEDDDESNVVIKTENVADENDGSAKMKQDQELIASILKKVSLPSALSSSAHSLLENSSLSVTTSNQKMEKIVNSAELSISKTNCNTNQGLAIGEEN